MDKLSRPWKELRTELLKAPEVKRAYEELEAEFQVARAIIALRKEKRMTQSQVARKAAIHRPMLSRIEGAKDIPTLPTLARLAAALSAKVEIRFVDRHNQGLRGVPPIRLGAAMQERIR